MRGVCLNTFVFHIIEHNQCTHRVSRIRLPVGDSLGEGWKRGQAQRNAEAQHNQEFPDHQEFSFRSSNRKGVLHGVANYIRKIVLIKFIKRTGSASVRMGRVGVCQIGTGCWGWRVESLVFLQTLYLSWQAKPGDGQEPSLWLCSFHAVV